MANAAKRMKEKKDRYTLAKLKAKGLFTDEEEVVEIKEVDSGTVTGVDVVEDEIGEAYTEDELTSMKKADLVNLAEALDVDVDGTKAELIERILNN